EATTAAFAERLTMLAARFEPDIVQLEYPIMGRFLAALETVHAPRILTEYDATAMARTGMSPLAAALEVRAWQRFKRRVIAQVDAVIVLTERDRAQLEPLAGNTPLVKIPLGLDVRERALDPRGEGRSIVYIGSYIHP